MNTGQLKVNLEPGLEATIRANATQANMSISSYVTLLLQKALSDELDVAEIGRTYAQAKVKQAYNVLFTALNEANKKAIEELNK